MANGLKWAGGAAGVALAAAAFGFEAPPPHASSETLALQPAAAKGSLFISPAGKPFRAAPGQPYPVGVWFAEADADHDGKLTLKEFTADAETFFKLIDLDHDGYVAGGEISFYEQRIAPDAFGYLEPGSVSDSGRLVLVQMDPADGIDTNVVPGGDPDTSDADDRRERHKANLEGAARFGLLAEPEPVTSADENFDYRITLAEIDHKSAKRFARLDAAKAGYLTLAGLPLTYVQINGARPPR